MPTWIKVAKTSEVGPGEMKLVDAGGEQIALTNVAGAFFALGDECTHAGSLLSGGYLDGCQVECPTHGALFDVKTGEVMSPPADEGTPTYRVKVDGQSILVGVPE